MTLPFHGDKPHMKTIDFAEGLRLPIEVASSPIALIAQRGRGKTRGAKKLAEAFLAAGIPPVILDPAGVWWGLRLAANGKSRGLDIAVLGGLHGDAPLHPTGGKVLAEALVRTQRACVIDTTGFATEAEKKRFASDFAETFYRAKMKSRTPMHLFLEEADEWVPERPGPDEARMLGAFQRITRLGRNFGIGITLISQRPQGLSKSVLNLAEVVITLGMAGAHETKAMKSWMDDHEVSAERRTEVMDKLPRLGWNKFTKTDGGALVWAPLLDVFGIFKVKEPKTFDSSATPEVGDEDAASSLPPLDLEDLSKAMAATVEEAKANDPKELRAEIARLKSELARKPSAAPTKAERVEVPAVDPATLRQINDACERVGKLQADERILLDRKAQALQVVTSEAGNLSTMVASLLRRTIDAPKAPLRPSLRAPVAARTTSKASGLGDASLASGERKILTVLAQYPEGRTRVQIALLTGYAHSGGSFGNYLSALRTRGQIHGREDMKITQTGLDALGAWDPLPTGAALREHWMGQLGKAEKLALEALVSAWPNTMTREDVAAAAGYEASGGSFGNALSRLRTLELIEGRTEMKASDTLFDEGGE